jgi:hypothetical protein
MSHYNKTGLKSVIKNASGVTKTFGFLPPHGVELTNGEEYEIFGNILEALSNGRSRGAARRQHVAFMAAIDRGDIRIISLPNVALVDKTSGNTVSLKSTANVVAAETPSWATTATDDESSETPA